MHSIDWLLYLLFNHLLSYLSICLVLFVVDCAKFIDVELFTSIHNLETSIKSLVYLVSEVNYLFYFHKSILKNKTLFFSSFFLQNYYKKKKKKLQGWGVGVGWGGGERKKEREREKKRNREKKVF